MTTDAVIRPATAADLAACAAIINDYIDATEWLPRIHSPEQLAAMFTPELIARRTVLVAETEDGVVGYLTMSTGGQVPALYLSPQARGRGIGTAMLERAKALCPGGLTLTVFEPNHAARRFYEREGFVEVPGARRVEDEGVPILLLAWKPGSMAQGAAA